MTHEQELKTALVKLLRAYEMLMPGLAHIAVEDYALINEAPIAARLALVNTGKPGATMCSHFNEPFECKECRKRRPKK